MRVLTVVLALVAALPATLPAQERRCEPAQNPKTLPPVSALLDSARIVKGLVPADLAPNGVLFSLVYSESDSFPRVHVIESSMDSAGLLLANAFMPQKAKNPWAVRVRIAGREALAVTLERSTYCPPALSPRNRQGQSFWVNPAPGDRMDPVARRISVYVTIAETGAVEEVRLSQSTGLRDFDTQIVQDLRMRQYLPALIDGFPVVSWWRTDGQTMRM